ncbi:hypothetical protein SESBI_17764 [Sesbania bispinosa]|nr:hypothetical protein SESBI_17764 [Sesbania bispinosa]
MSEYLSLAKTINITQMLLPSDIMDDIDKLNVDLNTAADTLSEKTNENPVKIKRVFNDVRLALFVVAAVMLLLALTGLVFSVLGYQHAILIFKNANAQLKKFLLAMLQWFGRTMYVRYLNTVCAPQLAG